MATASSTGSSYLALTDNQKRWLVVGIALNKILIPQIRPFVEQEINTEYNNLKISHNIHVQGRHRRLQKWPASSKKLKYENINGNDVHQDPHDGRFNYSLFDYQVKSHVDFARLYVEKYMAKFTAFDDHCDASAVLSLLGGVPVFSAAASSAGDVRIARNDWAHCVFNKWDPAKFQKSFTEMEQLIRNMALPSVNERELLEELKDWQTKGTHLCMNSPVDPALLQVVQQELKSLQDGVDNMCFELNQTKTKIQHELRSIAVTLNYMEKRLQTLEIGQQNLESRADRADGRLDEIEEVLGINRQEIERPKSEAIDHGKQQRIDEEVEKWKLESKNCLSDVFGRSKEIKQAVEAVQSGTVSIVSLTGGPGFGKTTVANKVADELDESEYDRSVLCCSLLSQATLEDVATTMFFVCDKSRSQPPENLTHWLRKWSNRQSKKVTLILDNADHVLESEDGQKFVDMLEEMRRYSDRLLTFIIVSGKTFNTSSCGFKIEHIKLTTLPLDDAVKVLLSRTGPEKQQLSQTEKIVELCGRIPLALRIIGPLLSRFTEARLIKSLENKPLEVLQDGTVSVEYAIKTSFDLLKRREQMALVIMSVFPDSFDCDAAEEVISKGMDIDADLIPILLSLVDRSLVEELSFERYQLHSLIKAFAKKVDRFPAPILDKGEKVACAHYMSRLADNANDYWSKDTCKQSLDSFNEERHNFEHFLRAFAKWRGSEAMESCEAFFVNLSQKCMYLEMCVLPRYYTRFLKQLLEAFSDTESRHGNQVQKVELLCLLGHEMRKVGKEEKKREKYKDYMMDAEKLYTENKTKFDESPFSAVIYLNSYARFLVEEKTPDKLKKVYEKALEICKDKLPNHPERVETLLRAGTNFKRRKEYKQAEEKFKQALALSEECLGKHAMTARCFKAIADLKFSLQEKLPEGAVLSNYEKSLEILKHLGMEGHKETIHTLKNLGSYHSSNGNYEEARIALERAELVADRELENDHMWKVRVKTEQALVLDKENKEDQMIEAMQNALEMCYRLGKTIEVLGNKDEIRKVLDRYPEIFPKDKYPR